jgi:hypothetical protein
MWTLDTRGKTEGGFISRPSFFSGVVQQPSGY